MGVLQFKFMGGLAALPTDTNWIYNITNYPPLTPGFKAKYRAYKYDGTIEYYSQELIELGIFETQDLAQAACAEDYQYLQDAASTAPPTLATLTPASGPGNVDTLVSLHGAGFDKGVLAQVTLKDGVTTDHVAPYNGPTATDFQIQLPFSDIQSAGTIHVAVLNGSGKLSNQLAWTVTALGPPVLNAMTPNAGLPNKDLLVNLSGNGFDLGAVVLVGSTVVTPTERLANSGLAFVLAAALIPTTGTYTVKVKNSDGQTSGGLAFTAQSLPVLSTMVPSVAPYGVDVEVTLNGTAFDAGAVVLVESNVVTPDSRTATVLTFKMAAALIPITGQYQVSVQNSDGGKTAPLLFTAQSKPTLTGMTPNSAPHNSVVSVTLTGTGFDAGVQVLMGSTLVLPDTRTGTTSLTFTATAAMIPAAGSYATVVQNSDGGTSNALTFTAT